MFEKVKIGHISCSSKEALLGGNLLVGIFDKGKNISTVRRLGASQGHLEVCRNVVIQRSKASGREMEKGLGFFQEKGASS